MFKWNSRIAKMYFTKNWLNFLKKELFNRANKCEIIFIQWVLKLLVLKKKKKVFGVAQQSFCTLIVQLEHFHSCLWYIRTQRTPCCHPSSSPVFTNQVETLNQNQTSVPVGFHPHLYSPVSTASIMLFDSYSLFNTIQSFHIQKTLAEDSATTWIVYYLDTPRFMRQKCGGSGFLRDWVMENFQNF